MLRRSPTALTISPEDLALFEELHARKLAHVHFRKTGEDPNGWFSHPDSNTNTMSSSPTLAGEAAAKQRIMGTNKGQPGVDPNDELKPLPGDKARIVRRREERAPGHGHSHSHSQGQNQSGSHAAGSTGGHGYAR